MVTVITTCCPLLLLVGLFKSAAFAPFGHSSKSSARLHLFRSKPAPQPTSVVAETAPYTQYFLDTADISMWNTYMKYGIFHGITTNPILMNRANVRIDLDSSRKLTNVALSLPYDMNCFMIQTWGPDSRTMVENGLELAKISDKVVVKVALSKEGLEAARELKKNGITHHAFYLNYFES
jgi:hypothetical protein